MQKTNVADIIEIQNLGYKFADSANRKDYEAFAALWAEEGVWQIGDPINVRFDSKASISKAISKMLGLWDFFVQLPHAPVIEINGDRATSRWTVNEVARTADKSHGNYNLSMYNDELVRRNGQWLYTKREYRTLYSDDSPLRGKKFEINQIANECNG